MLNGKRIVRFLGDSKAELGRVTWPGIRVTAASTSAVLVFVGLFSVYLNLVDVALSFAVRYVLG
jgi:preprotein translocase subunit SecE